MCIIAVRPKGKKISDEYFKNCFENNPDGCGFMYAKNGMVYGKKGIMSLKDFMREEKKIPNDVTVVFQLRISTHGGSTPRLTHPVPRSGNYEKMHKLEWYSEYGVAHNGIFTKVKAPEGESDTEVFISNILKPLQDLSKIKDNSLIDKYYDDIICSAVGSSKLVIMTKSGVAKMYGDGWVNGDDGCYYSNSTYSYSKNSTYNYCYGKDSDYDYVRYGKYEAPSKTKERTVYVVAVDTSTITEILPAYLKDDNICFVDKLGNIYYYSEYSGAFHQRVYKLKHFDFDENESFIITVKEYCDV